ncbi:NADPH-dependent 2,4-dienoyl-CoA reductase/sulfur reductase-like enzyme [Tumebacillus sp. BK434]|uniref:FAD-dependent oxidoreductase n=1 Tax=Tumebacillus sp. BK434 TaxID=2512169 RepID=UPI0010504911|nr:FAD-dependent oxidoreductase [Tumebacillus sp. BK434]TCP59549.1 NADPH-dependent 2,4-dienoyl-CoA reductase/sulfur reductase-like enzyme [Tumebacillus sp. BK434]
MDRFVVIGGDAAGMSAAMQIRRAQPKAGITIFEKGTTYSYAQCGLPYYIGGSISSAQQLIARTREAFQETYNMNATILHEAVAIDPKRQRVTVRDLETGMEAEHPYDKLLIATGGRAVLPDWEGAALDGVFSLKTLADAERIIAYAKQSHVKQAVVIGGGYIGLEMAEAFHALGKSVRVINRGDQVAGPWDTELAELLRAELERHGVAVNLGEEITGLSGTGGRVTEVQTQSGSYPADLVLVAVGIVPNSELAKEAGLTLSVRDAIQVNPKLETSHANIWAAGDVATQFHRVKNRDDYIPLGTHANKMGRIAGKQMAGGTEEYRGVLGTSILKVFDLTASRTGLSEAEAVAEQIPHKTVTLKTLQHAGYYPDAMPLHIRLVVRAEDGRLLGGQAVGRQGADKRIDVIATALWNGMTAEQLLDLDLAYAPPHNGVWDPVQQAARRL